MIGLLTDIVEDVGCLWSLHSYTILLAFKIFEAFNQHGSRLLKAFDNFLLLFFMFLHFISQILDLPLLRLDDLLHLGDTHTSSTRGLLLRLTA